MKYGFYVSGNAGRLKLLLKRYFSELDKRVKISFVLIDNISNNELNILCNHLSIPYYQYSYQDLHLIKKEQNEFISNKLLYLMEQTNSDYCFVYGGRILQGELLQKYNNKLINFHPSILPSYKGLKSIDKALIDNSLLLGNTAHFITEDLDGGTIIMQNIIPSKDFVSYDVVLDAQIPMLKQIIVWLEDNRLSISNKKVEIKDASYKISNYIPNIEI